ncbi:hypothetical protein Gotur_017968 [Gossypium turneri]
MNNPSLVELFAKIVESEPIQVVISVSQHSGIDFDLNVYWEDQWGIRGSMPNPEKPNIGGCSYNIPNSCTCLEIHLEVLATIKDGDEWFDNEYQSHHDPNDDFSDLNLDDILKDIDEEGLVEGQDLIWPGIRALV